ncbi:MAG: ABC transporter substrate-binding protein [Acholeplasmatales bacterium]|jgi:ABC-type branched-subunit amino acid transport system substrate-binding protein|nr:ABC transporter substrate-binding protein [Acholeplasmatales bacterium]
MKKLLLVLVAVIAVVGFASCKKNNVRQGITDTEILVGNTAATSGGYAGVGVPFNLAMNVVFDEYNASHEGRDIRFIHYDDKFEGDTGKTLTTKLVEEDKVFALVGHFGTNTVNATVDYIQDKGVPMVYGVTGVNSLYVEKEEGNPLLSIQPIYRTEGKLMLARALHEKVYGAAKNEYLDASKKILVLYTEDDAGQSILVGIKDEAKSAKVESRMLYQSFTATTADQAVTTGLNQGAGTILLSANQVATAALQSLQTAQSTLPVFTSYVNSAGVVTPVLTTAVPQLTFDLYANAWVDIAESTAAAPTAAQVGAEGLLLGWNDPATGTDIGKLYGLAGLAGFTAEYWDFVKSVNTSTRVDGATSARSLWANAYAMAGYVAAKAFVTLLERVNLDKVTWGDFIKAAESAPVDLPLCGEINWGGGARTGLDTLALTQFVYSPQVTFTKVREIAGLADVNKK